MIVLLENFASRQKYLPLNALADKKNQTTIPLWNILENNTGSKWVRISEENSTLFITFERHLNFIQFLYYTSIGESPTLPRAMTAGKPSYYSSPSHEVFFDLTPPYNLEYLVQTSLINIFFGVL